MGYDLHLEAAEAAYREGQEKSIADDAAVFVRRGYSRGAAIAKAREINQNQREADDDITGVLDTLAEAQSPVPPADNPAQTRVIAAALLKKSGS